MADNIFRRKKTQYSTATISLASPETILEWSNGEVTVPETINHRTYQPEPRGLQCQRIFGPIEDWKCACGKYEGIKYDGTICDRCGVRVGRRKDQRDNMGHIQLAVPIVHVWFYRYLPNKIGNLLGISSKKLENIIYYTGHIVIQPGLAEKEGIQEKDILTDREYQAILETLPAQNQSLPDDNPNKFIVMTGAPAIQALLKKIDLEALCKDLRYRANNDAAKQRRTEAIKRLRIAEAFRSSSHVNKPEWMVQQFIPVISRERRPLVRLNSGRFAMSDLTDLYRRLIICNNRLQRLIEIEAPDIILRNEKRQLQDRAVALYDNSRLANAITTDNDRPLKSLSDDLKGKKGLLRGNLLGKRVDFSGRTVIIPNPDLKLHECGLPKHMAAELFKPFIIHRLMTRGIADTAREAKKIIDKKDPVIWDILDKLIKGHPVLLNRAPTLHRLSVQAFQPKLIEEKALQIHPLVCTAFNADFDGDTMSVHVPLTEEAKAECMLLMLSSNNILNPANGLPIATPSKDMVLGLYYLTKERKSLEGEKVQGEGMTFSSPEEVIIAYENKKLDKHASINVRIKERAREGQTEGAGESSYSIIETTTGRVIFNQYVPEEIGFINELLTNKKIQAIVAEVYEQTNSARTAAFLDDIKDLGFQQSHQGGLTVGLDDIKVPQEKAALVAKADKEVDQVQSNYQMGFITNNERYNQVIDIWTKATREVTNILIQDLKKDKQGFNSIFMMMDSGARGSREQVRQLAGMRGLMAKPRKSTSQTSIGDIIETPILANFVEGLDILDFTNSAHGARKGLTDVAVKTADAGYLARKLEDTAQDVIIREEDCQTLKGTVIQAIYEHDTIVESLSSQIIGRTALEDIVVPDTKQIIVPQGELITKKHAEEIEKAEIESVKVRSVLTCETEYGVCAKCYGLNLASQRPSQIGDAVGVIAAQSIAEPGTQLTLRTFHSGGTAAHKGSDSTIKAPANGIVHFDDLEAVPTTTSKGEKVNIVISKATEARILHPTTQKELASFHIPYACYLNVKEGQTVEKKEEICSWDPYNTMILANTSGKITYDAIELGVTLKEVYDEQTGHKEKIIIDAKDKTKNPSIIINNNQGHTRSYNMPLNASLMVEEGQAIQAGQVIAKMPRKGISTADITTGGLPRVTELFEKRIPSSAAVVSEIDGIISYGKIKRGSREIIVTNKTGQSKKYLVSLSKHILVQDGDFVKACSPLSDGVTSIEDLAHIQGPIAALQYIREEIQKVYRLQGVAINNKHIEVILRQMAQKVKVASSGDTTLIPQQPTHRINFQKANLALLGKHVVTDAGDSTLKVDDIITTEQMTQENEILERNGKEPLQTRPAKPAIGSIIIQGITRAAITADSFLAAASFQETAKVLSEAVVSGKVDYLRGNKENVILGQLIPAGTGIRAYDKMYVRSKQLQTS